MDPKEDEALDSGHTKTIAEPGGRRNLPDQSKDIPWWLKSLSRGALVGLCSGCLVSVWGFILFVVSTPPNWPNVPWSPSEILFLPGILVPGLFFGLLMVRILSPQVTDFRPRQVLVLSGLLAALVAFLIVWPFQVIEASSTAGFALSGLASGIVLILGVVVAYKPARRRPFWMLAMAASGLCGGVGFGLIFVSMFCMGLPLAYACGHAITAMPLGWLRWKATVDRETST
jgi:hypothetical protein